MKINAQVPVNMEDTIFTINDTREYYEYEFLSDDYMFYPGNISDLAKPWLQDPLFIPTVAVYCATFLLGILGNGLVVFAMVGDRKSRSVTTTFLVSLAVADLLFLLFCVPYEIYHYFSGPWEAGEFLCKLQGFVNMLCGMASILNLMAVSVERFIVIVLPLRSRQLCTMGSSKKIVLCVWLVSVILCSPMFHVNQASVMKWRDNDTRVTQIFCGDFGISAEHRVYFAWYQLSSMFIIPSVIMTVSYAMVIYVLWLSTKQLYKLTASTQSQNAKSGPHCQDLRLALTRCSSCSDNNRLSPATSPTTPNVPLVRCVSCTETLRQSTKQRKRRDRDHTVEEARKQVIKMLITIIIIFLICWGPKLVWTTINNVMVLNGDKFENARSLLTMKVLVKLLPYIQSCLNPIIYSFMSSNFRRSIKSVCVTYILSKQCKTCGHKKMADSELDCKSSHGTTMSTHVHLLQRTRTECAHHCGSNEHLEQSAGTGTARIA